MTIEARIGIVIMLITAAVTPAMAIPTDGTPMSLVLALVFALGAIAFALRVDEEGFFTMRNGSEQFWTLRKAHDHVAKVFGDSKDTDGHFPSEAIMQSAARGDLYVEGRTCASTLVDDFGLNSNPRVPIPHEFWAENELGLDGFLSGEEASQAARTKRRHEHLRPPEYKGPQYIDLRVKAVQIRNLWPDKPKRIWTLSKQAA